jgi:cytoskeletal protein CcmA (bactofilin family)
MRAAQSGVAAPLTAGFDDHLVVDSHSWPSSLPGLASLSPATRTANRTDLYDGTVAGVNTLAFLAIADTRIVRVEWAYAKVPVGRMHPLESKRRRKAMWNTNTNKSEAANPSQAPAPSAVQRAPASGDSRSVSAPSGMSSVRPNGPVARDLATLGASLTIKGQITGEEDLQIDGKVEGPISLQGHRLTVGRSARLHSEVNAREVVVYGHASGNLRARERVEIKKDGEVIGDITTTRISIEDGAYFKGHIEIEHPKSKQESKSEAESEHADTAVTPVGVAAN